jgi:hypothetical protein
LVGIIAYGFDLTEHQQSLNTNKIYYIATLGDLTTYKAGLKYRKFPKNPFLHPRGRLAGFMTSKPLPHPKNAKQPCKHPRVQIVSRDEDAEFVECLECREVFESSELKDMSIEERAEREAEES